MEVGDRLEDEREVGSSLPLDRKRSVKISKPSKRRNKDDCNQAQSNKRMKYTEENPAEQDTNENRVVSINNLNISVVVDTEPEEAEQEEAHVKVQVDIQTPEYKDIREVKICKEFVPFVDIIDSKSQEQDPGYEGDVWPEDDVLTMIAAALDREVRSEEVSKAKRPFWAREILLAELSKRIDTRKNLKKWTKSIMKEILDSTHKVTMIRDIIRESSDESVAKSGDWRKKKL